MRSNPPSYSGAAKWLHWVTAGLILSLIPAGVAMTDMAEGPAQDRLYDLHRSFGMAVLALTSARLFLRLRNGAPPSALFLTRLERRASVAVHRLLYLLLFLAPVLGWLAMSAYGGDWAIFGFLKMPALIGKSEAAAKALFTAHKIAAFVIAGLVIAHIGGALRHALIKQDGLIRRMLPEKR